MAAARAAGVEHARRGVARPPRAAPARRRRGRRAAARAPVALRDVQAPRSPACRPASASSTACSAAGSCPGSLVLLGGSPGIGKSTLTAMALGNLAGAGARRRLRLRRGVGRADPAARRARCAARRSTSRSLAETDLDAGARDARGRAARGLRHRLGADAARRRAHRRARLGRPGARGRRRDHARRQGARHRGAARRARDEGGRARRAARARAPRRLRAAVRGRARAHLPHAARAEEPLRLDERGRRVRDALGRAGRGRSTPRRASSARRRARPAASCSPRWRASRPLLVEVQALVSPSELVPPRRRRQRGSTATASRSCSRCSRRHAGVGARQRRRVRQRRRRRAGRRAGRRPRGRARGRQRGARRAARRRRRAAPLACFGELGLTGELRWSGTPSGACRGAEVRARAGDRAGGRRRDDVATLRQALALAMPSAGRPRVAA